MRLALTLAQASLRPGDDRPGGLPASRDRGATFTPRTGAGVHFDGRNRARDRRPYCLPHPAHCRCARKQPSIGDRHSPQATQSLHRRADPATVAALEITRAANLETMWHTQTHGLPASRFAPLQKRTLPRSPKSTTKESLFVTQRSTASPSTLNITMTISPGHPAAGACSSPLHITKLLGGRPSARGATGGHTVEHALVRSMSGPASATRELETS